MSNRTFTRVAVPFVLAVASATFALAGPPLVCWKVETGNAPSLPWVDRAHTYEGMDSSYETSRLAQDTLALLAPDVPVLARMETLRRASLYSSSDSKAEKDLLGSLVARTQAEPKGALAWFDVGYFTEALRQARGKHEPEFWTRLTEAMGLRSTKTDALGQLTGYDCVAKAIELRGQDAEMEYAAALITWHPRRPEHERHLANAAAGAAPGSLLEKNLLKNFSDRGRTVAEIRTAALAAPRPE